MSTSKTSPLRRQLINVGCSQLGSSITTNVTVAEIVGVNQDDVGLLGGLGITGTDA